MCCGWSSFQDTESSGTFPPLLWLYIVHTHCISPFHGGLYDMGSSVFQSAALCTHSSDAYIQVYNFKGHLYTENSKFMYLTKTLPLNARLQFPNNDLICLFNF